MENCPKKLKTNSGKDILVCHGDYELFKRMKWGIDINGYPRTWVHIKLEKYKYKTKTVLLHKLLFKSDSKLVVDHINRNKLDNRRSNLRLVPRNVNSINSKQHDKSVGVRKNRNRWTANATENNKSVHIGSFKTKSEAIAARKEWMEKYYKRIGI